MRQYKAQILDSMVEKLQNANIDAVSFDEKLWIVTVDHVTVNQDDYLVFTMQDGREIRIKR